MQMQNFLTWQSLQGLHGLFVVLSFAACVAGLFLLSDTKNSQANDLEETEEILLRMSFTYWLVYCVAYGIQKVVLPDWEMVLLSLKITCALSYFLTFACILCLPMHRFAVRQVEE
jgi:peptidoglycan biosynthesis protein MviN/MurJ (putative lipid II flippase)